MVRNVIVGESKVVVDLPSLGGASSLFVACERARQLAALGRHITELKQGRTHVTGAPCALVSSRRLLQMDFGGMKIAALHRQGRAEEAVAPSRQSDVGSFSGGLAQCQASIGRRHRRWVIASDES